MSFPASGFVSISVHAADWMFYELSSDRPSSDLAKSEILSSA